jgi:hypothetical protein
MTVTHRVLTATLGAAILGILFVPAASACGVPAQLQSSSATQQLRLDPQNPIESISSAKLAGDLNNATIGSGASIVGMWSFQFISEGNTARYPTIPDGALLDFGYTQWHSDGTELLNSGGRAPAAENFCMGTWVQTGRYTYHLNHFALSYDATTGLLNGKTNIAETVTLSPGGTLYSGTFTITNFDTNGNKVGTALTGQVTADRITVDTTTP